MHTSKSFSSLITFISLSLYLIFSSAVSAAQSQLTHIKSFPGAEGFGSSASGGRFGKVIKVTNLKLNGPGSLQAALNTKSPRIIIFNVSGIIEGDITIPYGNVTIAGQTSPAQGITINGRLTCDYGKRPANIIIRHIRVRADYKKNPGIKPHQFDAIQCSRSSHLMFDHISVSGGVDENFDLYSASNVTVQWSVISKSDTFQNTKKSKHNYGLLNGPDGSHISVHHNIFAHNSHRNPAIANGPAEVINNVIYNVRHAFLHHNPASGQFNIIGNYFKRGSNDRLFPFFFDDANKGTATPRLQYFLKDNYIDDPGDFVGVINNPWQMPFMHNSSNGINWGWDSSTARVSTINNFGSYNVKPDTSHITYKRVLKHSGALPLDTTDKKTITDIKRRKGQWGISYPKNLLPQLSRQSVLKDSDNDGLPDSWEINLTNSISILDSNSILPSGYTAIEEYINSRAIQLLKQQ